MDQQTQHRTFRVTGLPSDKAVGELESAIDRMIRDSLTDEEKQMLWLKIQCVPSCDNETLTALVDSRGILPDFLSSHNSLGSWQVEMDEDDLEFDSHFFGFTQLYPTPEDEPVLADVIALTGLDGHAYESWRGTGNLGRMWLRDFLPKDLPNCRTMIYGYNAKLSLRGIHKLLDYSRDFLSALSRVRNTKELRERPIIFLAHSFGGLVLAHTLVRARLKDERDDPTITALHKATYAIFFFGTPHKGLATGDMMSMLEEQHPRRDLVDQLRPGSDSLTQLSVDFKNLCRDYRLVSVYESRQTRALEFNHTKDSWERTGEFVTIVEPGSSLLELPDSMEAKIMVDADHLNIIRYDSKNTEAYKKVRLYLEKFAKEAGKCVPGRFRAITDTYSTMPFGKDSHFIGRTTILEKIEAILDIHSRAGLYGLGGTGKSQIAIEYAYRRRRLNPNCHLFWVHASSIERFTQAYHEIAVVCRIPGHNDPTCDILALVSRWLKLEDNGTWLLILDNVDDIQVLIEIHTRDDQEIRLLDYLPDVEHGKILVTSRSKGVTETIAGPRNTCGVHAMNDRECMDLVRSRLSTDRATDSDIQHLVERLDHVPLAIAQACAYLNQNELISIQRYIAKVTQDTTVLQKSWTDLRRDKHVPNAVVDALALSFSHINTHFPLAANLLSMMAHFDRQGIPKFLIEGFRDSDNSNVTSDDSDDNETVAEEAPRSWGEADNSEEVDSELDGELDSEVRDEDDDNDEDRCNVHDSFEVDEALSRLLDFSLIRLEQNKPSYAAPLEQQTFEMHSLVQMAAKTWQMSYHTLHRAKSNALHAAARMAPDGDFENWELWRVLSPHISTVTQDYGATLCRSLEKLLYKYSYFLRTIGDYNSSEQRAKQSMTISQKIYGDDHAFTLSSIANLATTYWEQGQYKKAEKLQEQVMEASIRLLGSEHPDTLSSIANLASTYGKQGHYEKAEKLEEQVMEASIRILGPEHPDTLSSIANLASTYGKQGHYEKAEKLKEQVMEASIRLLGPEHPDTLNRTSNLAHTWMSQGHPSKAIALLTSCAEVRVRVLGVNHPDTESSNRALSNWKTRQSSETLPEISGFRSLRESSTKFTSQKIVAKASNVKKFHASKSSKGKSWWNRCFKLPSDKHKRDMFSPKREQ